MTFVTNVPQPTFGPAGFIAPAEADIFTGITADNNTAFGGNLNPALNTPQGQLASSETAIVGNVNDTFRFFTQQVDPALAQGRMQDAIARIYFLERIPSAPTVLQILCIGLGGVSIPAGTLIQDGAGNNYTCTTNGTIDPVTGLVTLPFANLIPGPTAIPGTTDVTIFASIPGWDAISVVSGVLGINVETQSAFERRRALSVAANSIGALPSIVGRILEVPGVLDAFVTQNNLNTTQMIGGFNLAANSLYAAVTGGNSLAVGTAIWQGALVCSYNGNTTVTVLDTNSGYNPPLPAYTITFEIPPSLRILFSVVIANSPAVPSNAVALVQAAIIGAFAGEDGGPRARIGNILFASRYYAPVAALGAWAQIVDIEIGSANAATATYIGSITAGVLTVTSISSGAIMLGDTLVDAFGAVLPGTVILAQTGGTVGGVGTYDVTNSQVFASDLLQSAQPNLFKLQVQIDQQPTVTANDIAVTLA